MFNAIAEVSGTGNAAIDPAAVAEGATAKVQARAEGFSRPPIVMWLAAIMLLLGTVGVLVTARIALAVLLALGPIFVVHGDIFGNPGPVLPGWLRGVVLTAVTPLFVGAGRLASCWSWPCR